MKYNDFTAIGTCRSRLAWPDGLLKNSRESSTVKNGRRLMRGGISSNPIFPIHGDVLLRILPQRGQRWRETISFQTPHRQRRNQST
jgi:hypothetical protein